MLLQPNPSDSCLSLSARGSIQAHTCLYLVTAAFAHAHEKSGLELEQHLGYPKHDPEGRGSGNSRNGATPKTVRGISAKLRSKRHAIGNSSFEPKIVAKRQTSVGNF